MNICFCVDSMGSGGAERVVANLSSFFIESHEDVSIIMTSVKEKKSFYALNEKVKLFCICEGSNKKINPIKRIKLLKKTIKHINPDVVISFLPHVNVYTAFALKGLKIPHVVSERNNPYIDPQNKLLRFLKESVFKRADGCVFQAKDAQKYYAGNIKGKSAVIYNPINLQWVPKDFSFEREKKVVSVGRLTAQKNFCMLIKAFKEFSNSHKEYVLEIYGDGQEKQNLIRYAKDLGIENKVLFMGNCKTWHEQAYKASMFVLSSNYEGMPNALLEAMAIGIPSISTDCPIGGPKEIIIDGKNGFLVPVGDYKALAEKMELIAKDEKLSKVFTKESNKIIEKISCESIGKQWVNFLRELVQKQPIL